MRPPRSRALRLAGGTLFALMLGLTTCGLDTPLNRFAFSGTSGDYMMSIISGSAVVQGLLLLGMGYGIYRIAQRPTFSWTVLVVLIALGWGLSGRKIGVAFWDEGRVTTGWFCIRTDQFILCSPTEDCETTLLYTSVIPLPFWRVRLANAYVQRNFFIGPVTWYPTLRKGFGPRAER
jgi:hypothetical protein